MQPDAEFVEAVVAAVLQQIETRSMPQSAIADCSEILVLAGRKTASFDDFAAQFPGKERLVASDDISADELADPGSRFVRIVVPVLCPAGMADLALGRASGREMVALLGLLLKGYQIEVGRYQYHAYRQSANPKLFALYRQYEKTLAEYGLTLFTSGEEHKNKPAESLPRLVTEKYLADLAADGMDVEITTGTLVTALARDYARARGITLKINNAKERAK